jgi:single-strand DNA-binding protein
MNKVILCGRLTKDPDTRYGGANNDMAVARFNLAVDRRRGRNADQNQPTADFISCIAFSKTAEVIEKYCHKGIKLIVDGRIQTGRYTNKDGQLVYTTDVVVENFEFAESAKTEGSTSPAPSNDSFVDIPDGVDEELPIK